MDFMSAQRKKQKNKARIKKTKKGHANKTKKYLTYKLSSSATDIA